MGGTQAFKAARDFLFAHREDYATAHRDFRWPEMEHFNYALDWFDAELATNHANDLALKIIGEGAATRTFAELSEASNRDYAPGFAAALMVKDVKLSQAAAEATGSPTPLAAKALSFYQQVVDQGDGGKDFSVVFRWLAGQKRD